MEIIRETTQFTLSGRTALSFGKFDGVHLGHRRLLNALAQKKKEGLKSVVFTFDISPLQLTRGGRVPVLTTREEKLRLFEQAGVDLVIEYPFTPEVMNTEAESFIENVVRKRLNPAYIAVGDDFRFGKGRRGNAEMLKAACRESGCETEIFEKLCLGGKVISSSLIREKVIEGNMEEAGALLGRHYSFEGPVVHGNEIGRTIGFPTLNIFLPKEKEIPPRGVYFTVTRLEGKQYFGVSNLGLRPTIDPALQISDLLLETHLLQYKGDAYGKQIEVSLFHFERAERRFRDLLELKKQINSDMNRCVNYFA